MTPAPKDIRCGDTILHRDVIERIAEGHVPTGFLVLKVQVQSLASEHFPLSALAVMKAIFHDNQLPSPRASGATFTLRRRACPAAGESRHRPHNAESTETQRHPNLQNVVSSRDDTFRSPITSVLVMEIRRLDRMCHVRRITVGGVRPRRSQHFASVDYHCRTAMI